MKLRKRLITALLCMIMVFTTVLPAVSVSAATADQKALTLYRQKIKAIKKNDTTSYEGVYYNYQDLDGNGIRELIVAYKHKNIGGSGHLFRVYTYKSGKVVCQLNIRQYGYEKIRYSRTSKAFRVYQAGHGGEAYLYYKLKNGKYVCAGYKSRAMSFGSTTKPWRYYVGSKQVSKATYEKYVGGTQRGTLRTFSVYGGACYR